MPPTTTWSVSASFSLRHRRRMPAVPTPLRRVARSRAHCVRTGQGLSSHGISMTTARTVAGHVFFGASTIDGLAMSCLRARQRRRGVRRFVRDGAGDECRADGDVRGTRVVFAGFTIALALSGPVDPSAADRTPGFTYAFDCGDVSSSTPRGRARAARRTTLDREPSEGGSPTRTALLDLPGHGDGGRDGRKPLRSRDGIPPTASRTGSARSSLRAHRTPSSTAGRTGRQDADEPAGCDADTAREGSRTRRCSRARRRARPGTPASA